MIASVGVTKSRTPRTDDEQSSLMPLYSRIRQVEGCEGVLALRDSATGDALTITFWADRTAMDSGAKTVTEASEAETSQRVLQALGIEVAGEPRIYEVTTNI